MSMENVQLDVPFSSSHVAEDQKGLVGVIAASVGIAKNKILILDGDEYQIAADEITLQLWEALARNASDKLYVNLKHTELTKLGYMSNVRVQGASLITDVQFVGPAFDISTSYFASYAMSVAQSGASDFLCLSIEADYGPYEVDEQAKIAYLRPCKLNGVSFVGQGALTEQLFSFSKQYQSINGDTMSKKEETKPEEIKVELAAKDAKVADVPVQTPSDTKTQDAEKKLDDTPAAANSTDDVALVTKVDAISAKLDAILAHLQAAPKMDDTDDSVDGGAEDDTLMAAKKQVAVATPVNCDDKKVKAVVKKEIKPVQVLSDISEEVTVEKKNNGEPSDEELALNSAKYWSDPKYQRRIINLSDSLKIKRKVI